MINLPISYEVPADLSDYARKGLEGHDVFCAGNAINAAAENGATGTEEIEWAGTYLRDGAVDCQCG